MGKQYLNGVLYGTGEIIKQSPEIYSLEEREVGVWIDGKPIYEITYTLTAPTDTGVTSIINTVPLNIDTLVGINGFIKTTANFTHHGGESFRMYYRTAGNPTPNNIACQVTNSHYHGGAMTVTLQYTKTTDTPGSGHYTTNGGEAHHYSTTEQVIGTWVDGKPIYEKTYIFDTVILLNSNTWTDTSSNGNFIKGIIDCKGYAENMIPNAGLLASKSSNNLIQLLNLRTSPINCIGFTLQYTKTTD